MAAAAAAVQQLGLLLERGAETCRRIAALVHAFKDDDGSQERLNSLV